MNELGQKIHDVICDLPAIYGTDNKRKKAMVMAYDQFRDKIEAIFCAESCLSITKRKELMWEVVDKVKHKIVKLDEFQIKNTNEYKTDGIRWLEVKAGSGKTEKSRRCKIEIWKVYGNCSDEWEKGTSSFYAPASMVLECEKRTYLPEFFVEQKLDELRLRSPRSQGYSRIPAAEVCWPGAAEYMQKLISLLPTEKEIEQAIEDKRINDAKLKQQRQEEEALRKIRDEERRKLAEKAAKEAEERAEKNSAAKLARRAKQEQVHNVNVMVKWSEMRGGKVRRGEYELENVSLYYVGKTKVDIVESDGEETRKNRTNVIII